MGCYNLETMQNKKIAIVDCNNFYVSCERLFNPKLNGKPTVVLSNNDGCVIARSQEIKDMGVKMGQPLFKLDDSVKEKMTKFSSNYVLYGDISDRISNILRRFTPQLEIYSIDESFMDLSHISDSEMDEYIKNIKSEVFRLTGIPVSIGVAPNKTLAKLMNFFSKKDTRYNGLCNWFSQRPNIDDLEIDEVWGIGYKWKKKLNSLGIEYIGQFKKMDPLWVRKLLTVVGLRTWFELNGDLLYKIETKFKKPKIVTSSRSFGTTVWQKDQVHNALWTFIEDATTKLKVEGLKPRTIILFATTNRFDEDYFVWCEKIRLWEPTNDPQLIWNQVFDIANTLPMKLYYKAGILAVDLVSEKVIEKKLFVEDYPNIERPDVKHQLWMTRRDFLSPEWTTNWSEVPKLS